MSIEHITKIEVLTNSAGKWFWRAVAANGEVIDTAGQAFASKADAIRAAEMTKAKISVAPLVVADDIAAKIRRALANLPAPQAS